MNRLTKRIDGSLVFPSELIGIMMTPSNDAMYQILTRLAAYEDTGLEPEEIEEHEAAKYNAGYYHGDEGRCRWIPFSEQRENTTQARKVTINGRTQTLKSWCREFGISYNMVIMRVHRGMDDVAALLTPKQRG